MRFASIIVFFLLSAVSAFSEETLTLTTYYPSPQGVYRRLMTSTLGVGDNDGSGGLTQADSPDPAVAANAGDLWVAGDVGIGTRTPAGLMHLFNNAGDSIVNIDVGDNATSKRVSVNLLTRGSGTTWLGWPNTKGWNITARGDGFANAATQNDLSIEYWDSAAWKSALYIDSLTRNVGIGTPTPEAALNVLPSAAGGIMIGKASGGPLRNALTMKINEAGGALTDSATIENKTIFSGTPYWDTLLLNPSGELYQGKVAVGHTSPGQCNSKFCVYGDTEIEALVTNYGTFSLQDGGNIWFMVGNNFRGWMGWLSGAAYGSTYGPSIEIGASNADGSQQHSFRLMQDGEIRCQPGTCTQIPACSDIRLKKDITPVRDGEKYLEKLKRLQGVTFRWKDADEDNNRYIGLIAQDVAKVFPEITSRPTNKDDFNALTTLGLQTVLLEAIKAQQEQIEALKGEIAKLKKRI